MDDPAGRKPACDFDGIQFVYRDGQLVGFRGRCRCGWWIIRVDKDATWERLADHLFRPVDAALPEPATVS